MCTASDAYDRTDTTGPYPPEFVTLAKNVGPRALPLRMTHTEDGRHGDLTAHRPIGCADDGYGFGHHQRVRPGARWIPRRWMIEDPVRY